MIYWMIEGLLALYDQQEIHVAECEELRRVWLKRTRPDYQAVMRALDDLA